MFKKWGVFTLVIIIFFTNFTGCANSTNASTDDTINVTLDVIIEKNVEQNFYVSGSTNLPNNMELVISVNGLEHLEKYSFQEKVTILNGTFKSKLFVDTKNPDEKLNAGAYIVTIKSLVANEQPQLVRNRIGKDGTNLEGPHVSIETDSNIVFYSTEVEIEGRDFTKPEAFSEGVNYTIPSQEIINELSRIYTYKFERRKNSAGTNYILGAPKLQSDTSGKIEIIGNTPNDLHMIFEIIPFSENQFHLWHVLTLIFPDWYQSRDWIYGNITEFRRAQEGKSSITIHYGDKYVSLSYSKAKVVKDWEVVVLEVGNLN